MRNISEISTGRARPEFVYEVKISGYGLKKRDRKWKRFSSSGRVPAFEITDVMRQDARSALNNNFKFWTGVTIEVRELKTHDHGTIQSIQDRTIKEGIADSTEGAAR